MVFPSSVIPTISLGTSTFGWTTNESQSKTILNSFLELGGFFIDTADSYSQWQLGNIGGEAETYIGNWLKSAQSLRKELLISSKVGKSRLSPGLSPKNIVTSCDQSLLRLKTDYIDIYYMHTYDQSVPLEESLNAFERLFTQGKIRGLGLSNFTRDQLLELMSLKTSEYKIEILAFSNHYNLLERDGKDLGYDEYSEATNCKMETEILPLLKEYNIPSVPYHSLARGFLTGKYFEHPELTSVHSERVRKYNDTRGRKVIERLKTVSDSVQKPMASVALEWLRSQHSPTIPAISVRNIAQLKECMERVRLTPEEILFLTLD